MLVLPFQLTSPEVSGTLERGGAGGAMKPAPAA